jgi:hypothetical protein
VRSLCIHQFACTGLWRARNHRSAVRGAIGCTDARLERVAHNRGGRRRFLINPLT